MARAYAKIPVRIWRDDRFLSLRAQTQWLYFLIASHPRSLYGVTPINVPDWATCAPDVTEQDITDSLYELIGNGFAQVNDEMTHIAVTTLDPDDRWYPFSFVWQYWALRRRVRPPIPPRVRRMVIARDGLVCALCSQPVPPEDVHIDHIFPWSRGGTHDPKNLQVAHSRCNIRKGARI